jgi:hypothetical protein
MTAQGIKPFNFSKAATTAPVMPDGRYEFVFVKHDMKVVGSGNNRGAPMLAVQAKPYKEFHPRYANTTVFRNIPLIAPDEEKGERGTFWVMTQFLEALGLSEDEMESFDLDTLKNHWGKRFTAAVTTREYEGEKRNEINKFKPSDGTMPDGAADPEESEDDDSADKPVRSRLR